MSKKLLDGVKVCDFSRVIVGPLTTKPLSDYGATVVRIEGRSNLEIFRIQAPEPDLATQFTQWNTGKLGVTLNLNDPRGKEIALKIAAWADIVVENFAGGVITKLGLGYEEIKKVNPNVIMLSSCMQGQTGPFARHPGWGFQLSALSGFSHITGWTDVPPPELGVYTDFITPQYNVCLLIGALLYRKRTGKGMFIDTAQFETGLHFISPLLLDYFVNNRVAERMGNRSDTAAPHNAFRCKDEARYCVINISSDEEWEKLCGVFANPEWTKEQRFSTQELREANKKDLRKLVEEWATDLTVEDVINKMQAGELTAERLLDNNDAQKLSNAYRCKDEDRWCAIAVTTDEEWATFCKVIGSPDWTKEMRFSTLAGRKENEDELDRLVEGWTTQHLAFDVMNIMQDTGVPAGVVETGEDQLEHDLQTRHRNFFQELDHPRLGKHHAAASPFQLSKVPCEIERAPLLGEHNEYVLKEILGYTDEEIVDLVVNGVLE
ncbi:MAG: CoA transferase [Dehalococcoidales bacterium]|nr:CoA transferase [Dehalococcoidales bacterium]